MTNELIQSLTSYYPNGVDNLVWCGLDVHKARTQLSSLNAQNRYFLKPLTAGLNEKKQTISTTSEEMPDFQVALLALDSLTPAAFFSEFIRPQRVVNALINILVIEVNDENARLLPCVRNGRWFPFCEVIFVFTEGGGSGDEALSIAAVEAHALAAKFMNRGNYKIEGQMWCSFSRGLFWIEYHDVNNRFIELQKASNKTESQLYHLKKAHQHLKTAYHSQKEANKRIEKFYMAQIDELRQRLERVGSERTKIVDAISMLSRSVNSGSDARVLNDSAPSEAVLDAKSYWFCANWEALSNMKVMYLRVSPDFTMLLVLKAAAAFHLGDITRCRRFVHMAVRREANKDLLYNMLLSSLFNSLSNIAFWSGDRKTAQRHLYQGLNGTLAKNALNMLTRARPLKQILETGLPSLVVDMIDEALEVPNSTECNTAILRNELSLVRHMLMQAYTRGVNVAGTQDIKESIVKQNSHSIAELKQFSPSQLGQDIWALRRAGFKRNGFFVEFGAADGILLSNSFLLEKKYGWRGLCAEPNPQFYNDLKHNRNCTVSDACISGQTGETVSFILAKEYGGIQDFAGCDMHAGKRDEYTSVNHTIKLKTVSMHDFLKVNNAPNYIDYISIDTEGSEWEILKNFPFDEWNVRCLTVEHNGAAHKEKLRELMKVHGYKVCYVEHEDWYYKVGIAPHLVTQKKGG